MFGEGKITQWSKMRDLGFILDQFLNFDDHITPICKNTHLDIRNMGAIRNLLIDNIYCNIPNLQSNVEAGLLQVNIADHKEVFCINNDSEHNLTESTCTYSYT